MSVSNCCLSHCALQGSGLRRMAGRDVAQSRAALPYPFPPALVALTLTCAPSDRAPWISAKSISLFRGNSPISFLPAHTSCDVSLFGAEVHRKNRLSVRPSGRTAAEDRLTSDQPRPIVNRSRKAASARPRGAVRDRAYRGRRLKRVAQAMAAPIAIRLHKAGALTCRDHQPPQKADAGCTS